MHSHKVPKINSLEYYAKKKDNTRTLEIMESS